VANLASRPPLLSLYNTSRISLQVRFFFGGFLFHFFALSLLFYPFFAVASLAQYVQHIRWTWL
jgi:hypothetical protein